MTDLLLLATVGLAVVAVFIAVVLKAWPARRRPPTGEPHRSNVVVHPRHSRYFELGREFERRRRRVDDDDEMAS